MIKEYKFYKTEEAEWFIDLPDYINNGGFIEELQMVAGADLMLDILSNYGEEVNLLISTEEFEGCEKLIKSEWQLCTSGACYDLISQSDIPLPIWLCDVTKYVFGNFPEVIYFKVN